MKAGKRNYLFQRSPEGEKCKIRLKSSHIPHASFKTSWKHGRLYFPATTTLLAEVCNAAIQLQSDELPSSQSFRSKMSNWQKKIRPPLFHLMIVFYDLGLQMEYFPRN